MIFLTCALGAQRHFQMEKIKLQSAISPPASLTCDDVPAAGTAHLLSAALWVLFLQQVNHLGVVCDGGAVAGGTEGDGQVHTGIIVLT